MSSYYGVKRGIDARFPEYFQACRQRKQWNLTTPSEDDNTISFTEKNGCFPGTKKKEKENSGTDSLLEGAWVFFLFFFLAMHAERNSDIITLSKRRKQFKSHFNGKAFLRSKECFLYKGWMILKTFRKIFLNWSGISRIFAFKAAKRLFKAPPRFGKGQVSNDLTI